MAEMVKLLGTEFALSTANNAGSASVVRVYNNTAGAALITLANTGGTIGTCTLGAGAMEYFQKAPADTLSANATIRAVKVAFN